MEGETREKVFQYIRKRLVAGAPPTIRDVQLAFGFRSCGTAREHVEKLIDDGRLEKVPGIARGLRLPAETQKQRRAFTVPVLGSVTAGFPELAYEEAIDNVMVTTYLPPNEVFALKVKGDSMRDAGIFPGDLVIVKKQSEASNGQIVIARLGDEEATVKTLRVRSDDRRELHPANPDYPVLYPTLKRPLTILGIVFEIRRSLPLRVEYA
jgi:repressor LexA